MALPHYDYKYYIPWNGSRPLVCLVRLFHVDELLLQTAVLRQELFQLSGVVLEVTRIGGVMVATHAILTTATNRRRNLRKHIAKL